MAVPQSSYRDRTSEFNAILERLKRNQNAVADRDGASPSPSPSKDPSSTHSDFNKEASKIGQAIHEASKKVERLSNLAKRSRTSIFDDSAPEIQGLTSIITQDLTKLNNSIQQLESVGGLELRYSQHSKEHNRTVLTDLKEKLMRTTNDFKDVLTARTENLKRSENRKQLYNAALPNEKGNAFMKNSTLANSGTQVPWAKTTQTHQESMDEDAHYDTYGSSHLRRRSAVSTSFSPMQSQLQMEHETTPLRQYTRTSSALRAVESTIAELSGMFTQVATMVSQQSELAIRIDDNMDETLNNVEGAQTALLRYLHQVSTNRWLIIKIFIVLITVLLIYILLMA